MIFRPDRPGKMAHRMIQPGVQFIQQLLFILCQFRVIRYGAQFGMEMPSFVHP